MNILSVSKLQKEFNGEVLFKNVSFEINSKDKTAIIGKNGSGKSTLLKMILGDLRIDSGEIHKNSKAVIGYLSQDVISNKQNDLITEMNDVFSNLIDLEDKIKDLTIKLEEDPHNEKLINKYASLENIYLINGGYEYHYKINLILSKFGFDKEEYTRSIDTFSGGERTRIAFAKLLLIAPDLLILDEPTNHLDISIIEWLEDYLNKYEGAVLIVTHDKYFITKVCRKIIEIDHKTSNIYYGSFENYLDEKVKRYELLLKNYTRQQKEIAHLQSFVDRFRYNAKRASIAQDRVKKINRIVKLEKPTNSSRLVKMAFENKRATRDVILEAKNLSIGYDFPILNDINFSMCGYDKLAIIGPNGTGKTTLLKVIEKKLLPLAGKIDFLREYKIGYFDQNQENLSYNKTVFEEIHDYYPMYTHKDVRSVAARFLFTNDDVLKSISILSGGEKVRLVLLLLMLSNPDLLILDEPTNHLDIETKDIIEDVINEFSGPVLFVSHDRYFINKICTKIVHLSDDSMIEFEGSYDEFKEIIISKIERKKTKKVKTLTKKVNNDKEIRLIEKQIHSIENKIKQLESESYKEDVFNDYKKINKINKTIKELEEELATCDKQYYELLNL
ncbi:MAG: ABC-F family ATP-binding cassette domain-containing protein [Candidatus Izimaplasma sp.]|nr:ABC-F family ATP-binding cassette domain-containing protein [Candidatus Izimaplasma bacterium]